MDCDIFFYMSHKTGYIQRTLAMCLEVCRRECGDLQISKGTAAVSPKDFGDKLAESLSRTDVVFVMGGLSFDKEHDVMELLSDYFADNDMEVTFNKRVENPEGGRCGYIVRSGNKYVTVLPDEPEQVQAMVGKELLSSMNLPRDEANEHGDEDEPREIVHTVVFAPQPDDTLDKLKPKKRSDILLKVSIAVGIATVLCAVSWLAYVFVVR